MTGSALLIAPPMAGKALLIAGSNAASAGNNPSGLPSPSYTISPTGLPRPS
ncbi:MAG: hypothetical protein LAN84_08500 [Acidobacteriia bacterium]|nr:hypothetical protein [Terriglobia bacterium]